MSVQCGEEETFKLYEKPGRDLKPEGGLKVQSSGLRAGEFSRYGIV